jgi:hypothetical protein
MSDRRFLIRVSHTENHDLSFNIEVLMQLKAPLANFLELLFILEIAICGI